MVQRLLDFGTSHRLQIRGLRLNNGSIGDLQTLHFYAEISKMHGGLG